MKKFTVRKGKSRPSWKSRAGVAGLALVTSLGLGYPTISVANSPSAAEAAQQAHGVALAGVLNSLDSAIDALEAKISNAGPFNLNLPHWKKALKDVIATRAAIKKMFDAIAASRPWMYKLLPAPNLVAFPRRQSTTSCHSAPDRYSGTDFGKWGKYKPVFGTPAPCPQDQGASSADYEELRKWIREGAQGTSSSDTGTDDSKAEQEAETARTQPEKEAKAAQQEADKAAANQGKNTRQNGATNPTPFPLPVKRRSTTDCHSGGARGCGNFDDWRKKSDLGDHFSKPEQSNPKPKPDPLVFPRRQSTRSCHSAPDRYGRLDFGKWGKYKPVFGTPLPCPPKQGENSADYEELRKWIKAGAQGTSSSGTKKDDSKAKKEAEAARIQSEREAKAAKQAAADQSKKKSQKDKAAGPKPNNANTPAKPQSGRSDSVGYRLDKASTPTGYALATDQPVIRAADFSEAQARQNHNSRTHQILMAAVANIVPVARPVNVLATGPINEGRSNRNALDSITQRLASMTAQPVEVAPAASIAPVQVAVAAPVATTPAPSGNRTQGSRNDGGSGRTDTQTTTVSSGSNGSEPPAKKPNNPPAKPVEKVPETPKTPAAEIRTGTLSVGSLRPNFTTLSVSRQTRVEPISD